MKTVDQMKEHIHLLGSARDDAKARVRVIAARVKQGRQEQRGEHARSFAQRLSSMNGSTA